MDDPRKQTAGGGTSSSGEDPQPNKKRAVLRCPIVASVEVTEPSVGTRLSARISELGMGGCYVDTLNPFPEGTLVRLQILRDNGAFESGARVVYSKVGFGMGLAFTEMTPNQRSVLEDWLAEFVTKRTPAF